MDIQEVIDLKKQLEEDFRKDTEAIDRVMALLQKTKAVEQPTSAVVSPTKSESLSIQATKSHSPNTKPLEIYQPPTRKFNFAEDGAENNGNKNGNKFGRVRDTGVKGIAKQVVPFLPKDFQRKDLITTMADKFPAWADKLTKDAINGALARLLEDKLVVVKEKARGKFPATYSKTDEREF